MTLEEAQEQILKQQEEIKTLKADKDVLTTKNNELTAHNEKLVEHNNKLFARISQPIEEQPKQLTEEEQEAKDIAEIRELMKKYN